MEDSSPSVIGAIVGFGVGIKTAATLYNEMIPSAHADESGAIGVVIFPIAATVITCGIVTEIVNFIQKQVRKVLN